MVVGIATYFFALIYLRDTVPAGLNNDAAEETLRGIYLIEQGRFEPITSVVGIPQETLYEYVGGAVAKTFGTTTLAIQATSWCAALACLALFALLVRRIEPSLPPWMSLLLAGSSIWLFHYARSGLRAISAPFFLLAVALLLDRAERDEKPRAVAIACGAALALSLYAYTSCRVLVVALAAHAAIGLLTDRERRPGRLRAYGWIAAGFLVVSLPNLLLFAKSPADYLLRGSYVMPPTAGIALRNTLSSLVAPLWYSETYRTLAGPTHIFDGVSAGLTSAGIDPVSPLVALAMIFGGVAAWRRRREGIVRYLLLVWAVALLSLGPAGPSLTRLLILLPVFLALAALGIGSALGRWPRLTPAVAVVLLVVAGLTARAYFGTFAGHDVSQQYFSPVATPMGERARTLALQGKRCMCVVAKDANVLRYLTHDAATLVHVDEFFQRPLDERALPIATFAPQVLLVDRSDRFKSLRDRYRREQHVGSDPAYDEIDLGAARP